MKRPYSAMSIRWQRLLCFATWGVFIALASVSLPFLFDLVSRGIGWVTALFPHPAELWKECPRCL
jgi:hypothetical protein